MSDVFAKMMTGSQPDPENAPSCHAARCSPALIERDAAAEASDSPLCLC